MEIITDSVAHLPPRAGEAVERVCGEHNGPVLVLFSGGSALSVIEHVDPAAFAKRATVGVLDERIGVAEEHSNMAQLEATDFYQKAITGGAAAFDPREVEGEGPAETAAWFEMTLRAWVENNRDGIVVITQGIGEDGHTAGILPFPNDTAFFERTFNDANRWAVGYETSEDKDSFSGRVTVTIPFLRGVVTSSVVYAVGEKKQSVLDQIINRSSQTSLAATPGRVITEMNDVLLCTSLNLQ